MTSIGRQRTVRSLTATSIICRCSEIAYFTIYLFKCPQPLEGWLVPITSWKDIVAVALVQFPCISVRTYALRVPNSMIRKTVEAIVFSAAELLTWWRTSWSRRFSASKKRAGWMARCRTEVASMGSTCIARTLAWHQEVVLVTALSWPLASTARMGSSRRRIKQLWAEEAAVA